MSKIARSNVIITARVIDPFTQAELGEFKTIQPVEHYASEAPAQIVEYALEISDDVKDWADLNAASSTERD